MVMFLISERFKTQNIKYFFVKMKHAHELYYIFFFNFGFQVGNLNNGF